MRPRVLGLDPSLQATGVALPNGTTAVVRPGARRGVERLIHLRNYVVALASGATVEVPAVDMVVIEGMALGTARQASSYEMGGLGWVLRVALTEAGVRWIEVPPATLKKYATGRGNASKEEVLATAIRRLGFEGHDFNEADAAWLRVAGMELLDAPVVELPRVQVAALDGLRGKVAA